MSLKIGHEFKILNAPKWSISARLTVWYCVSAFTLVTVSTGILYLALLRQLDQVADRFLTEKKEIIYGIINNNFDPVPKLIDEVESEPSHQTKNTFWAKVLDDTNKVLVETKGIDSRIPFKNFNKIPQEGSVSLSFDSKLGRKYSLLLFQHGNGQRIFKIIVAIDRSNDQKLLAYYRSLLIWILIFTLFLASLLGFVITYRGLKPIRQIASKVTKIKTTTLNERIETKKLPKELASLADVFNEMLDRLEGSFDRLSRFSADIAHELRTPIHNLRGEIEVGISKSRSNQDYLEILGSCMEECSRLSNMVDSLLFIARAEDPSIEVKKVVVQILPEIQKVKDFFDPLAQSQHTSISIESNLETEFLLEKSLFQRVVANLLSNSLKHTKDGKIVISTTLNKSTLILKVEDNGCGISPKDLPNVTDRFYRCDSARSASQENLGLGLSIVKSIAQLHQGSVEIQSRLGQGTTVSVSFST